MKEESNNKGIMKGMPTGIPFIISNEAAERFSYYGMKCILIVFMVKYLKMSDSDATAWYHNFSGAVYALPLAGALLSDLFLGKYKTILYLSIVYCLGHLVLALNETQDGLFCGLMLIAIGSGGIKPCVSAHVGDQFDETNKELVPKVFSYFYFAINFGSFFSTLLIPYLEQEFGPALAFGLPGFLMFVATVVFWMGRNKFIHIPARPKQLLNELWSKNFLFLVLRLGAVYLFISIFWALYDQTGSSWVIQSSSKFMIKTVNLGFTSFELLPAQIQSANPVLVMLFVPLCTFLLFPFLNRFFTLKPLFKIAIGMFLCAFSFFIISYIEGQIHQGQEVSVLWQLLAFVILTLGEVFLSMTALEYSYTQAPVSLKSIIMGFYLLSISIGNFTTSAINKYIVQDLKVNSIEINEGLFLNLNSKHQDGDKVNISSSLGLILDDEAADTLQGTFTLKSVGEHKYQVLSTDQEIIKVKESKSIDVKSTFTYYSLNGSHYFDFFAYLMLVTSVLFLPLAFFLKDKTILQKTI